MKILIVDDHSPSCRLLRGQLEAEGNVVLVAHDGVEALRVLEKQSVDAVISDILMPRMDGLTLCQRIRTDPRFQALPFIIYTSTYDSPTEKRNATLVGADKYVVKPASSGVLMAALREACSDVQPRQVKIAQHEMGVMREYNAALVRKLEENNAELAAKIEELRQASELNRQIVTSVREGIVVFDRDLRYRLFNSHMEALTGWRADDVLGKTLEEVMPSPKATEITARLRRALNGEVVVGEDQIPPLRPGDPAHWISTVEVPLHDAGGQVVGVLAVINDTSERKTAEERIRHQARLLDLASDAILEQGLDDRILYWNKGAERLYGWHAEEVVGGSVAKAVWANDPVVIEAKKTVLRTGAWSGELKQMDRSGREIIVNSRWTLLRDERDQPKSILVINTNITGQKALEAQFFRAQRLESIGTLASGIAHDLNNILAPILMSAPILRLNLPPKEVEKILGTIETSAQRGADLVRQLLTFGRGVEGEHRIIRVEPLVREMAKIVQQTFSRNISVVVELPEPTRFVRADSTQLHQVLLNLCVNARDAMPDGGTLTLGAENVHVDESFAGMMPEARPGKYVMLRVGDTGVGIRSEIIEKIFDPFFTTKESGKGTGLGLATVIGIVKSHGGFVNLRSEVGHGTVFFVYLPASDEASPATDETAAVEAPRGSGELLLVVDDEESIRSVVAAALTRHGYQVATATDGADAVAHYARLGGKVRAVVTDIDMPIMDGVAMIQVMKRLNPELRVLVSSGLASSGRVEARKRELEAMGVVSILVKPYTTEKILRELHTLLKK